MREHERGRTGNRRQVRIKKATGKGLALPLPALKREVVMAVEGRWLFKGRGVLRNRTQPTKMVV